MQDRELLDEYFAEGHFNQHLLKLWDFEELLATLRRNPVLLGRNRNQPIIAKDYFAQA